MLHYLKKYPLTWLIVFTILYLSFFKPPQTDMEEIPGIDKLVHICMYGGLCFLLWIEYLRSHQTIDRLKMFIGGILLPITFSGTIELAQSYCTEHRGGDWLDLAANTTGVLLAGLSRQYYRSLVGCFGGVLCLAPHHLEKERIRNAGDSLEQPTP